MESNEQGESALTTTELGRDADLKFMKATNRTMIALLEKQEALEELLLQTIEWLLGAHKQGDDYMGYQLLKLSADVKEYKAHVTRAIRYTCKDSNYLYSSIIEDDSTDETPTS